MLLAGRVAVTGLTKERRDHVTAEITTSSGETRSFAPDETNDDEVVKAVSQVLSSWGQIDIVVNNAGVSAHDTPTWKTTNAFLCH